ncbi:MAG: response regulator transcription factor [Acidobacteria bacterium]|nr:response regulator transcription factor [Acidobacteriota bacterium]
MKRRVLIGEHDEGTAQLIKRTLEQGRALEACIATDGFGALQAALQQTPDLIVLDAELFDPDGMTVCRMLRARQRTSRVPIVMISDHASDTERVRGLSIGADDYVAKPFNIDELRLRVRSMLRRYAPEPPVRIEAFESGSLKVNFTDVFVEVDGGSITLTRREFELLQHLIEHRNRVCLHARLLRDVWYGIDVLNGTRTVAVHMARLRAKLGQAGTKIETIVGLGYRFNAQ